MARSPTVIIDMNLVVVYRTTVNHHNEGAMLTFVEESPVRSKDKHKQWICRCSCGDMSMYLASRVRNKRVNQCRRCGNKDSAIKNSTHGMKYTDEYRIWGGIKTRCGNINAPDYCRYGERGIKMCQEWSDSFERFFQHIGPRPSREHSIDRIDNNKGYEPGNVRWSTRSEQGRNKSNCVYVTDGVRVLHINDIAEELKITRGAAHLRLKRGKLNGFTKN